MGDFWFICNSCFLIQNCGLCLNFVCQSFSGEFFVSIFNSTFYISFFNFNIRVLNLNNRCTAYES